MSTTPVSLLFQDAYHHALAAHEGECGGVESAFADKHSHELPTMRAHLKLSIQAFEAAGEKRYAAPDLRSRKAIKEWARGMVSNIKIAAAAKGIDPNAGTV